MYTTQAIVLSSFQLGEADELTSFYTEEFGKLTIKVRGAKKITTKQGNFLHEPSLLEINFIMSRANHILSGIKSIKDYPSVTRNLYARGYLSSYLQLCNKLIYDGQHDEALWDLFSRVFRECQRVTDSNRENIAGALWRREKVWLFQLMTVLGFKPERLDLKNIKSPQEFDNYLKRVFENKFEQQIDFFGSKAALKLL